MKLFEPYKHDKRTLVARSIYTEADAGNYIEYKTTRGGCTTAMAVESLNRREPFLVLAPTRKIGLETVAKSVEYSDRRDSPKIIDTKKNDECIFNQILCETFPALKKLKFMFLGGQCEKIVNRKKVKCEHYNECPITEILRTKKNKIDGMTLTYHKLVALMLASMLSEEKQTKGIKSTSLKILEVLKNRPKNVILDEVHELQAGKQVNLPVYDDDRIITYSSYRSVVANYPYLQQVIDAIVNLTEDSVTQKEVRMMVERAEAREAYKDRLSIQLPNNHQLIFTNNEGKVLENQVDGLVGVYCEIQDLVISSHDENGKLLHPIEYFLPLYDMLQIAVSKHIAIHAIKRSKPISDEEDEYVTCVNIVANDDMFIEMIANFTRGIQNGHRRVFLTSATIGSFDYSPFFEGEYKQILFGKGGDPMNTNANMLVLADSKKYHNFGRNSQLNRNKEIVEAILKIMDTYGDNNVSITAISQRKASMFERKLSQAGRPHKVQYYKSTDSMGVSCDTRIRIAIGAAHKPSSACDAIKPTKEESNILRIEMEDADTWQDWSRVKDPEGKEPSVVFGLGCNEHDCRRYTTWGYNRKIVRGPNGRFNVECEHNITSPRVVKCHGVDEMLVEAAKHMKNPAIGTGNVIPKNSDDLPPSSPLNKYIMQGIDSKCLIVNNIRQIDIIPYKKYSVSDFIKSLFLRSDAYITQMEDGSYISVKKQVTNELIQSHLNGVKTIGAYTLGVGNMVSWMCFDINAHSSELDKMQAAEQHRNQICNYLDAKGIPYLLESPGTEYSYHIWLFLEPVLATVARKFGDDILKDLSIKGVIVYPRQATINNRSYGNAMKVPFGINRKNYHQSKVFIDGEWVSDIKEISIGRIKITQVMDNAGANSAVA